MSVTAERIQYEAVSQSLYDTMPLRKNDRTVFFSVPMGVNGKTRADTNMGMSTLLPPPTHFVATGLRTVALEAPGPHHGLLTVFIGSKSWLELPLLETLMFGVKLERPFREGRMSSVSGQHKRFQHLR